MAYQIKDENGNVLKIKDVEVWATDFEIEVKQPDDGDGEGRRVISMVGSTPSIDRDNDIINQSGWDTRAFKKSSPVLWSHDHKIPAIAKVNKFNKSKDALTFDEIEFPEKGIHALSDMIFELMAGGFIKAGSVGFLPIKTETRDRTDEEEKNEPQSFCPPTTFIKQELLEFSIVNVGSNRDAIVTHLGEKGFKTSGKIKVPDGKGEEIEVDIMDVLNKLLAGGKQEGAEKAIDPLEEKEKAEGGLVTDPVAVTLGDSIPETVITIPDKEKDADGTDKTPTAEILRLKDGGFLFDFQPTKEKNEKGTRYCVNFVSDSKRCQEADLQEWDDEEKEWKTVQTISIQDIEQKAGAVLNKSNKKRLKDAQLLIGEVLSESEPADLADKNEPDTTNEPPDKEAPALELTLSPEFKELFDEVSTRIAALESRLDKNELKPPVAPRDTDIDLERIKVPEKEKDEIDLSMLGDFLKKELPRIMKDVVDKRVDKALGKV